MKTPIETDLFLCPNCDGDGYTAQTSYSVHGHVSNGNPHSCLVCHGERYIRDYACPVCGKQLFRKSNKGELFSLSQYDQIKYWLECECGFKVPICRSCDVPLEYSDSYAGETIRGGDVVEVGEEKWICPKCGYEEK